MAASTESSTPAGVLDSLQPRIVDFVIPGDPVVYFARRFGRAYYGMNRWRGWRLCGVHNKRAGAALVDGSQSIRVHVVT